MARVVCKRCARPEKTCLCAQLPCIENVTPVLICQHPSEERQAKGTAKLTALSLQNCKLWVGETFGTELQDWCRQAPTYLLFPSTELFPAEVLTLSKQSSSETIQSLQGIQLLVLDGTWKKCLKMLALNPVLQQLPRLSFETSETSQYGIRKQRNAQSFSTIEAVQLTLALLEADEERYQPLSQVLQALVAQVKRFQSQVI